MRRAYIIVLLAFILTILGGSCSKSVPDRRPNVILIVPDALRAQQLPSYGYQKISTPAINSLVKKGIIFKNCFVKTPSTATSFSNIFSGSWSVSTGLKNEEKTLAQYLKEKGYYTVGFVSSRVLWTSEHNEKGKCKNEFNRGFDEYIQDTSLKKFPYHRKSKDTTADILSWLDNHKDLNSPFFLFAHYMDPHSPYDPSYDKEIEKIDFHLNRIISKLKELSLYDNSLIIFSSDHGESFGEHNSPPGHGWLLYKEQTQVPLIMRFPEDRYRGSVNQIVRNVDIMPTILNFIGIKYDRKNIEGKSLIPAVKKNKDLDLIAYLSASPNRVCPEGSESIVFSKKGMIYQFIRGMYSNRYRELYCISKDPFEENNLYTDQKYTEIVTGAEKQLKEITDQIMANKENLPTQAENIDEKELEALKSLGYIGDGAPAPFERKRWFLMTKRLDDIGYFVYTDFIRKEKWGVFLRDKYHPVKLVTLDNKDFFIIANNDHELFRYNKEKGFQSLKIKNIQDIALHPQNRTLYFLHKGILKTLRPDRSIKECSNPNIQKVFPYRSVYIDQNGNIYLFREKDFFRFDKKGLRTASFNIPWVHSNHFEVDEEGNIYIGGKDKILKFDPKGNLVKKFGKFIEKSSVEIDNNKKRIWSVELRVPIVKIYNKDGEMLTKFRYNDYNDQNDSNPPIPIQIYICKARIYFIDAWEGIFVYSLL